MYGTRNQVVLPLNLETRIKSDDPVFKLAEICDSLDYTELYSTYIRTYRKYDPAMLFMLLVFAYMNGIYSSREIEKACRNDIRFMWILQNSPVPDHATIAHFQNERLSGVMQKLFYQLVVKLSELGELEFRNVFVDGTKIDEYSAKVEHPGVQFDRYIHSCTVSAHFCNLALCFSSFDVIFIS